MAMYAKDGSRHHSASRASMHDSMSAGAEKKANVAPMKKPAGAGEKQEAPSPHSIEDHVREHGPAVEMHHKHDKATGKHRVVSHHGDGGEKHVSEHDTAEEAYDHMGKAMGVQQSDDEGEAYAGEETPDEEAAEEHARIPGLA